MAAGKHPRKPFSSAILTLYQVMQSNSTADSSTITQRPSHISPEDWEVVMQALQPRKRTTRSQGPNLVWEPFMGGGLIESPDATRPVGRDAANHISVPGIEQRAQVIRRRNAPPVASAARADLQDESSGEDTKLARTPRSRLNHRQKRVTSPPSVRSTTPADLEDDSTDDDTELVRIPRYRRLCHRRKRINPPVSSSRSVRKGRPSKPSRPKRNQIKRDSVLTSSPSSTSLTEEPSSRDQRIRSTQQTTFHYGHDPKQRSLTGRLTFDADDEYPYIATFHLDGFGGAHDVQRVAQIKAMPIDEEDKRIALDNGGHDVDDFNLVVNGLFLQDNISAEYYRRLEVTRKVKDLDLEGNLLYVNLVHVEEQHQKKGIAAPILKMFRQLLMLAEGAAYFNGTLVLIPGVPSGHKEKPDRVYWRSGKPDYQAIQKGLRELYERRDGYRFCVTIKQNLDVLARPVWD